MTPGELVDVLLRGGSAGSGRLTFTEDDVRAYLESNNLYEAFLDAPERLAGQADDQFLVRAADAYLLCYRERGVTTEVERHADLKTAVLAKIKLLLALSGGFYFA